MGSGAWCDRSRGTRQSPRTVRPGVFHYCDYGTITAVNDKEANANTIDDFDLYGGFAGINPSVDAFDFGQGITLRKTYAHFMAPFLMAFAPAERGKPHPAPWKSARGGLAIDIQYELHVPKDLRLANFYDRLNTIWWFTALIRLKGCSQCHVPVIANYPFSVIAKLDDEPNLMPVEIDGRRLMVERKPSDTLDLPTLEWLRDHWHRAGVLAHHSEGFNVAFQAYDGCIWTRSVSLALVAVWGALERLFSPARAELKFRVSANIAAFLESPGASRLATFKKVQKLYDARSAAAHGSGDQEAEAFFDTCDIMRRVLLKIIDRNSVPTREELDNRLLGNAQEESAG